MLNKGVRSEQDQRINSILEKLITLVFVPENWNEMQLESELNKLGLSIQDLKKITSDELNQHLVKFNFEWNRMEEFADILVALAKHQEYSEVKSKAKALYEFVQIESKAFSFEIMNKISRL